MTGRSGVDAGATPCHLDAAGTCTNTTAAASFPSWVADGGGRVGDTTRGLPHHTGPTTPHGAYHTTRGPPHHAGPTTPGPNNGGKHDLAERQGVCRLHLLPQPLKETHLITQ